MALSDTLSALADYSWSDIKKAAKHAMVTAALGGQNLSIGGRVIGRISIEDAKTLYEMASEQEQAESSAEGTDLLVQYRERV